MVAKDSRQGVDLKDVEVELSDDTSASTQGIFDQVMRELDAKMEVLHKRLSDLDEHLASAGISPGRRRSRPARNVVRQKQRRGNGLDMDDSAPVSDDERMLILQMLQEQKITVEEAETLLAALEGM